MWFFDNICEAHYYKKNKFYFTQNGSKEKGKCSYKSQKSNWYIGLAKFIKWHSFLYLLKLQVHQHNNHDRVQRARKVVTYWSGNQVISQYFQGIAFLKSCIQILSFEHFLVIIWMKTFLFSNVVLVSKVVKSLNI